MYLVRASYLLKKLYHPAAVWKLPSGDNKIYLTFDDGPVPETTPFVLETLRKFNALATFFCVGENVSKYPELYSRILENGHSVGNHTFNHLKGWKTADDDYLKNVARCGEYVDSNLFRPPYGRITKQQGQQLDGDYRLIFWTILSGDFDNSITPEMCYKNVIDNIEPGAIIVFHDSIKAFANLQGSLERVLEFCTRMGYEPAPIPQDARCSIATLN